MGLLLLGVATSACGRSDLPRLEQFAREGTHRADRGNGLYRNPIIAGDLADPSVIREGEDFYMIHGKGLRHAIIVWHSRDLVNWQPIGKVPLGVDGGAWAPDLALVDGRYYIYVTIPSLRPDGSRAFKNWAYWAEEITGPWSEPIDLEIDGLIDPGHLVTPEGKRYLFMEKTAVYQLAPDGLSTVGPAIQDVYDGWEYPEEWDVECWCLESPKLLHRDGYYYVVSALGGTKGPATAHMAAVERSRDPLGPYVDSPYNPLIHTFSIDEQWWAQGHATLVEHHDGTWWAMFHGIDHTRKNLGRQTLLLPVDWTDDGWPVIQAGARAGDLLAKPSGENVGHGLVRSDDFSDREWGYQWAFEEAHRKHLTRGAGALRIRTMGDSRTSGIELNIRPGNHSFEIRAEIEIMGDAQGGLMAGQSGVGLAKGPPNLHPAESFDPAEFPWTPTYWQNGSSVRVRRKEMDGWPQNSMHLRVVNHRSHVSIWGSEDGENWKKFARSFYDESGGVRLFAFGEGEVIFRDFRYRGLE